MKNLKKVQDEFDGVKWYDSIREGEDKCGTYVFCAACRKEETYPCARAAERIRNGYIRIATVRVRTRNE